MSAKYKSPSFLLPNEINTNTNPLNTDGNPATGTGINSLYSMDFAVGKKIQLGSTSNFNFGDGDWSICWWMKLGTLPGQTFNPLIDIGGYADANTNAFIIYIHNTRVINVYKRSGINLGTSSITVKSLEWNFCTLVKENQTITLNIFNSDNQSPEVLTTSASGNFGSSTGNSYLAGQNSSGTKYYDGKLDEVSIFNRALNTTEIAALYGGTSPNIYPSNLMATDLNPIAYYPLGEQAQNSGYLSATGNEWQFPNGVLQDYVMDFDGVNDFVDLGNLQPSTTSLSISAWAYKTDTSNASIIGRGSSVDYGVFVYGGNLQFGLNTGSWSTISTTFPTNQWFHVLATWDGATMKLYVNRGTPVTASKTGTITYTSNNTTIGKNSTLSGFEWDGKISNLAIWNTDQSTNIANIYNNGSPQTTYTVTPQNWWKLNATSVYTPSAPNYTTALEFNGASSTYVDLNNITSLNGVSQASYSFWFKLTSSTPASGSSSVMLVGSNAKGASCYYYNTTFYIHNLNTKFISTAQPSLNNWHHVCCVFNSGVAEAYVDGISVGTVTEPTLTTTASDFGNNFNIGYSSFYSAWINNGGQISNLALFNSALSASQVSTLFNFGTPETNISFSPQAWWKLDDQNAITDSSGNGNTGTNNGATNAPGGVAVIPSWKIPSALPITTTPNYTTALDFDAASGDEINTNYTPPTGASARTISIWFYQDASGNADICGYGTNTVAGLFDIILYGGNVYIHGYGVGQEYGKGAYTVGVWNHYVITYDGTTAKGYVNNVATPENTVTLSTGTTNTFKIGNGYYNIGNFNGKLSNFSVWNSALTSAQVSTLYNAGTPETAISFSPVSWWKLDTGGSIITDSAGSNNGTNSSPGAAQATSDVLTSQPVNGVSTTLPSTALQQSDLQFDSPYSNYSLSFDGATYIDCTDNDMFSFGNDTTDSPFSVSFWTKLNSVSGTQPFLSKDTTSPNREWAISIFSDSSNGVRIFLKNQGGDSQQSIDSSTALTTGVWYHITTTYDGRGGSDAADGLSIYINGSLDTPTNIAKATYTAMSNTTAPVYIGKYSTSEINGKIDETAIFNTELTSAQVLEIYNNGRPKDLSTFSGTAPISWWRLGENAYFQDTTLVLPNSITGAPNGEAATNNVEMVSADAPGTYANGIGTNLDILDRVGDAPLSTSNSQSYNMIPSDISPYVPGYVGLQTNNIYSMNFDGSQNIDLGNSTQVQPVKEMSISAWINASDLSGYLGIVSCQYPSASYDGFSLHVHPSYKIQFTTNELNGSKLYVNSTSTITTNQWYHLAVTYDGANIKLYFNGSFEASTSMTANIDYTDGLRNTKIGSLYPSSLYFTGQIDEVAIWDTALNADQVNFDLYQPSLPAGSNKTADIANNPNLPNPVAWYRMGD